ncbi:head-to-tail joining protein [Microcystis phage vB_MweS-yong2]|nr:head-to-tail joining protein [Microcystis phage vB_MweS-yong2]
MAWTQADIDALKAAMATGAKSAEFRSGDTSRRQEFRSLAEMQQLLAQMQAEVAGAARAPAYAEHSRD